MLGRIFFQKNAFSAQGSPYAAQNIWGNSQSSPPIPAGALEDNDGELLQDNDGVQLIDNVE